MRLVDYMLSHGVKFRETADYLIKNRMVKFNGNIVTYAQLPVDEGDDIEFAQEYADAPPNFWKIKEIDEAVGLLKMGDFVLDVESQDGGFPLYAARKKANVTLVTIREDMNFLKKDGVELKIKNIVREPAEKIFSSKFDTVLLEISFDVMKGMQLLEKIRPYIGSRGKLLMFVPVRGRENVKGMLEDMLIRQKLMAMEFFDGRKGIYVYAKVV